MPTPVTNSTLVPFGNGTGINVTVDGSTYVPPACLSGKNYTVASGDNCQQIAQEFSVATGSLEIINGLYADYSNLEAGESM